MQPAMETRASLFNTGFFLVICSTCAAVTASKVPGSFVPFYLFCGAWIPALLFWRDGLKPWKKVLIVAWGLCLAGAFVFFADEVVIREANLFVVFVFLILSGTLS